MSEEPSVAQLRAVYYAVLAWQDRLDFVMDAFAAVGLSGMIEHVAGMRDSLDGAIEQALSEVRE